MVRLITPSLPALFGQLSTLRSISRGYDQGLHDHALLSWWFDTISAGTSPEPAGTALQSVVRRHESLRTVFRPGGRAGAAAGRPRRQRVPP